MADHSNTAQRNRWDVLTQTGAGTPMGELLRRYWWPIAGVSEFDAPGTRPVRLLGEDLVLYKDLGVPPVSMPMITFRVVASPPGGLAE